MAGTVRRASNLFCVRDEKAGRQSRTAAEAHPDRKMRVLWVTFVVAIGVMLIGAMFVLNAPSGRPVDEPPTQTSHSAKTGSAFDK
jgi:hypothetical protein